MWFPKIKEVAQNWVRAFESCQIANTFAEGEGGT